MPDRRLDPGRSGAARPRDAALSDCPLLPVDRAHSLTGEMTDKTKPCLDPLLEKM